MSFDWLTPLLPVINMAGIPILLLGIVVLFQAYQRVNSLYKEESEHLTTENERLRKRLSETEATYFSEIDRIQKTVSNSLDTFNELKKEEKDLVLAQLQTLNNNEVKKIDYAIKSLKQINASVSELKDLYRAQPKIYNLVNETGYEQLNSYYKILQVDPNAETEVIEAAYKRLALKYHPDINKSPDAEEKFHLINEARKTLTDSEARQKYDQEIRQNTSNSLSPITGQESSATEGDIWGENAVRSLAAQILVVIKQSLSQKRWRLAKEKLYVFEGLGAPPKDSRILPTFGVALPEWQKAKELDTLADQQASEFKNNLQKRSIKFYCTILGIIGLVWLAIAAGVDDFGMGILFGIAGAVIGVVLGFIVAPIGTWVYTKWYAGKWGEGTDNTVGVLTPIILVLVVTFGIYIVLAYVFLGALFQYFANERKR